MHSVVYFSLRYRMCRRRQTSARMTDFISQRSGVRRWGVTHAEEGIANLLWAVPLDGGSTIAWLGSIVDTVF